MMLFIALGFCAQLIDGCLGMAYGVFLTTFLTMVFRQQAILNLVQNKLRIFKTPRLSRGVFVPF